MFVRESLSGSYQLSAGSYQGVRNEAFDELSSRRQRGICTWLSRLSEHPKTGRATGRRLRRRRRLRRNSKRAATPFSKRTLPLFYQRYLRVSASSAAFEDKRRQDLRAATSLHRRATPDGATAALISSHGDQRIHARRTSCRQPSGRERRREQDERHHDVRQRIGRRDAIEESRHDPRPRRGGGESDAESDEHRRHPTAQNVRDDRPARRA